MVTFLIAHAAIQIVNRAKYDFSPAYTHMSDTLIIILLNSGYPFLLTLFTFDVRPVICVEHWHQTHFYSSETPAKYTTND